MTSTRPVILVIRQRFSPPVSSGPFRFLKCSAGSALVTEAEVPCYDCALRSAVPFLDCAAVEAEDGSLSFFLVNRAEEPMELSLELPRPFAAAEHRVLRGLSLSSAPCALTAGSAEALLTPAPGVCSASPSAPPRGKFRIEN